MALNMKFIERSCCKSLINDVKNNKTEISIKQSWENQSGDSQAFTWVTMIADAKLQFSAHPE